MNLHLVQYSPDWEDKQSNMDKIRVLLKSNLNGTPGTDSLVNLIIMPEMTLTGFTMKSSQFAEELTGDTYNFYKAIALEYHSYVAAGLIETSGGKYYNTLLLLNPSGELINSYRKIHPFSYSTEDKYFSRGDKPVSVTVEGWKVGLSICYDLRFPELYRHYGKNRNELIINIANWPDTRIEHWKVLLRARAIENQCYMAGVNRTGKSSKLNYTGCSSVYDPMGNETFLAPIQEGLFSIIIEKKTVYETRQKFPFLDDIHMI